MTLHAPPDLTNLRLLATQARDGHRSLGANFPPSIFVPVHHDHLLALLDAVELEPLRLTTYVRNMVGLVATINQTAGLDEIRGHVRTIARLTHEIQETQ